jgi:nitroreductase
MATHDVFALMAERRSVKRFAPRPVEMDKVLQIIQAGALAPSAGNMQNWNFLIITDIDMIREMYNYTLNQESFLSAMVAIVVCGDVEQAHMLYGMRGKRLYTVQNCAAAIQNILLASQALDLGAIWIGAFDEDKVTTMLKIPSHINRPQAIILLGYADYEPEHKEVKPLEAVVFFNAWGNRVLRPHLVYYDWATEWRMQGQKIKAHLQDAAAKVKPKPAPPDGKPKPPRVDILALRNKISEKLDNLKKDEYRKQ